MPGSVELRGIAVAVSVRILVNISDVVYIFEVGEVLLWFREII